MDKQAQDEFDKEMRDYLRASVGSFLFWDNELDAEYERVDTPVVPASSAVSAVASGIAAAVLKEAHDAGQDIHIPSLGITIPGKTPDTPVVPASSLEALCDDYAEVMLREAGNIHSGVWEP